MRFFVATVTPRQVLRVEVSAVDEPSAVEAAMALVNQRTGPASVMTNVSLVLRGESDLSPGTRVVHEEFGPGEVSEIDGKYAGGWRLPVKFDRGDIKELHAPHPCLRPEALLAVICKRKSTKRKEKWQATSA